MTDHLLLSFYQGMFDSRELKLPDRVSYKKDINQKGQFWAKLKEFMNDGDIVCEEIFVNAIKYQKGDLLVNHVLDGAETLKVGRIRIILVKGEDVFFVNTQYVAHKHKLGYYVSSHIDTEIMFTKSSTLADPKPLILRGTAAKFAFVLHHHVSFDYN